ncbi:hypothetical protein FRB94_003389 [Tulasnella sp. JGI-2019a]|nr:hypothetical protein FRB93_004134 [Tulasnella sp. JGI-2019a]KAG9003076.1 hypothetical protein FRB94_003389 [Tulasnella sp. JGI-2019a]
MTPIVGRIAVPANGISATLLVLQLNMFQNQTRAREDLPLATGPTFKFAGQEGSSSSEGGESPLAPVVRRRRASMSMALYQSRGVVKDITDLQTSSPLQVTFTEHNVSLSENSTTTAILAKKEA